MSLIKLELEAFHLGRVGSPTPGEVRPVRVAAPEGLSCLLRRCCERSVVLACPEGCSSHPRGGRRGPHVNPLRDRRTEKFREAEAVRTVRGGDPHGWD